MWKGLKDILVNGKRSVLVRVASSGVGAQHETHTSDVTRYCYYCVAWKHLHYSYLENNILKPHAQPP